MTIIQRTKTAAEDLEDIDDLQIFAADLPDTLKKQFVNLSQRLEDDLREDLILVVDESGEYLDGLQETLANVSGGELKLYNCEFKLTAQEVGKDIETMEKAFAEKRRQIAEIERAIESAESNISKARKLELSVLSLGYSLATKNIRKLQMLLIRPRMMRQLRHVTKNCPKSTRKATASVKIWNVISIRTRAQVMNLISRFSVNQNSLND